MTDSIPTAEPGPAPKFETLALDAKLLRAVADSGYRR
jgi:hypothetical protein